MSSNASLSDVRNHYNEMHITIQNSFRLELAENCETIFNDYGEIEINVVYILVHQDLSVVKVLLQ